MIYDNDRVEIFFCCLRCLVEESLPMELEVMMSAPVLELDLELLFHTCILWSLSACREFQ